MSTTALMSASGTFAAPPLAIIAVPAAVAQEVVNTLVDSGIVGILNFVHTVPSWLKLR